MTNKVVSALLVCILILSSLFTHSLFASATTYKVGDIVEFGSYPQTQVTDEGLISQLNDLDLVWCAFSGFYYGNGNDFSMEEHDYIRFADIEYNSEKYRAIYFTSYRPNNTILYPKAENSYQDNNGYFVGQTYWFKYEPIKWKVLDPFSGIVMTDKIIDCQPFNNTTHYYGSQRYIDENCSAFVSDYFASHIRLWLNSTFFDIAFSAGQKSKILETNISNKCLGSIIGMSGYTGYDSESTTDKVFLLAYNEIYDGYGFTDETSRMFEGTDYSKCFNLRVYPNGHSYYLLRTPGNTSSYSCIVNDQGTINQEEATYTTRGVCPVIRYSSIMSNSSHIHSYEETTIEPTCTQKGFTEYNCFGCGDTIIGDYTNALGHDYSTEIVTKPATCTENGTKLLICSRCSDKRTEVIEASGHSPMIEILKEPTCSEPGIQYEKCSVCGERLGEDTEITAADCHNWKYSTDRYTITAVCETCNETFSVTALLPENIKCSDIAKEITVNGEVPDNYVVDISYSTDDGLAPKKAGTYTASFGLRRKDLTNITLSGIDIELIVRHDLVCIEGKAPSCTEDGCEPYEECKGCDYSTYKPISALGHNYKATYKWSEDCKTCSAMAICENNSNHTLSEEATVSCSVKTEPTCTEKGMTTYTATFSNTQFSTQQKNVEDVSPTGHIAAISPAKEATCNECGLTEGSYCSVCGETLFEQKEIPKLDHVDTDNDGHCDLCDEMMVGGEHCTFCGQIHTGFFGTIVKFFHQILSLFIR